MPTAKLPDLSAAELELKRRGRRRLVGAITIGVVAVIVLPMLFDAEPKRKETARQEIEIKVPPKDGLPPLALPVTPPGAQRDALTDAVAPATAASPAVQPAVTAAAPKAEVAKAAQKSAEPSNVSPLPAMPVSVAKADAKPVAKADTAPLPKPATIKAGFVIQIGAFKDADNANAVVTRMKEARLPVFSESIAVKTGTVMRVRVGPYATKDSAESALAQVKLAGVDGKVVALP